MENCCICDPCRSKNAVLSAFHSDNVGLTFKIDDRRSLSGTLHFLLAVLLIHFPPATDVCAVSACASHVLFVVLVVSAIATTRLSSELFCSEDSSLIFLCELLRSTKPTSKGRAVILLKGTGYS